MRNGRYIGNEYSVAQPVGGKVEQSLEHRETVFVEVMIVIAVIGVLAFLIGLVVRMPQRQQHVATHGSSSAEQSPRWYEFTLALILLAAVAAFALWLISNGRHWVWGETIEDWRSDDRTIAFAVVMVVLAVIGLVISLVYGLAQSSQGTAAPRRPAQTGSAQTAEAAPAGVPLAPPAPSPLGVLGLLALALAILLLCWISLAASVQYGLIVQLIYPAGFAISLVLLFDKAARTWNVKPGAESFREWLLCDLLVFLLVLAFLNARSASTPEAYAGSFWDLLNLVLFLIAFWVIDRTAARGRFLIGYAYLVVLPVLLSIWQTMLGIAAPTSWWASAWPFLILASVFFILEAVALVASTAERQTLPAIKDTLFVVLYAVLLIVAAKSA
jgi:hypothetical protein